MKPVKLMAMACLLLAGRVSADSILELRLPTNDVVCDPTSQRLYASVPGIAGGYGNSIVSIDPERGTVYAPLWVGSEPGRLAISSDARYLYVALNGAAAVRRVDLRARRAELQFPVGQDREDSPFFAGDLEVLPGQPESLAVSRHYNFLGSALGGVAIYDNGVPRPRNTRNYGGASREIEFSAAASRLYGFDELSNPTSFHRLLVDPQGVSPVDFLGSVSGSFFVGDYPRDQDLFEYAQEMRLDGGRIYLANGMVIDPEVPKVIGTFPSVRLPALVRPDAGVGRVFFLTGQGPGRTLTAFDINTMALIGTLEVPGVNGRASGLIRWGLDGLAFRTSENQLFLIRTSLVPAAALSVASTPAALVGGGSATGRITLRDPAPTGGTEVRLTSSVPAAATVPVTVTVPAGASTAAFPISTAAVASDSSVTLTATANGVTGTARLQVAAATVVSVAFNPNSARAGVAVTGTVGLTGPAPAGGLTARLSSTHPTVVSLPASVSIPAGQTSAAFPVAVSAVTTDTPVDVTAAGPVASATGRLKVTPPVLLALTVEPTVVAPGATATGTVTVADPAPPGGLVVPLYVDWGGVSVPGSVTVPAGATTATFPVRVSADLAQAFPTLAAYLAPITKLARLEVRGVELVSLTLDHSSAIGGTEITGTVTLAKPAPSGSVFVRLTSGDAQVAQVLGSVQVPQGATTAAFLIRAMPVATARSVTIAAATSGAERTASLSVLPPGVDSVSLDTASVTGGAPVEGTVRLAGPAPSGGAEIALVGTDSAVVGLPGHVQVPAGETTVRFPVDTHPVAAAKTVVITAAASANGVSRTVDLQVLPVALASVTVAPDRVTGGRRTLATITLSGPAPAGGVRVRLASDRPTVARPPAAVTVRAGASSVSVAIDTSRVTASTPVEIFATTGDDTKNATLTVLPFGP